MNSYCRKAIIEDVYEVVVPCYQDARGTFQNCLRTQDPVVNSIWGERIVSQINISTSYEVGSIRGIHFQKSPFLEAKLVRCLRGRVWDVAVDLRVGSATWGEWHAVELSPCSANSLLVPEGCGHGFQVLEADTQLLYVHSAPWVQDAEAGVRFDDPQLSIDWPMHPLGLSERDLALPLLESFL